MRKNPPVKRLAAALLKAEQNAKRAHEALNSTRRQLIYRANEWEQLPANLRQAQIELATMQERANALLAALSKPLFSYAVGWGRNRGNYVHRGAQRASDALAQVGRCCGRIQSIEDKLTAGREAYFAPLETERTQRQAEFALAFAARDNSLLVFRQATDKPDASDGDLIRLALDLTAKRESPESPDAVTLTGLVREDGAIVTTGKALTEATRKIKNPIAFFGGGYSATVLAAYGRTFAAERMLITPGRDGLTVKVFSPDYNCHIATACLRGQSGPPVPLTVTA